MPKNSGGRPPIKPDIQKLEALCSVMATDEEIAATLGVSHDTVARWKRHEEYGPIIERGRAAGRVSLRRSQFQRALAGDSTMLVWLGKTVLGQKETVMQSGDFTMRWLTDKD